MQFTLPLASQLPTAEGRMFTYLLCSLTLVFSHLEIFIPPQNLVLNPDSTWFTEFTQPSHFHAGLQAPGWSHSWLLWASSATDPTYSDQPHLAPSVPTPAMLQLFPKPTSGHCPSRTSYLPPSHLLHTRTWTQAGPALLPIPQGADPSLCKCFYLIWCRCLTHLCVIKIYQVSLCFLCLFSFSIQVLKSYTYE